MKKIITTSLCLLFLISSISSQDFDSAIGLRVGYPLSVTYKKFISESGAIEAYAGYRGFLGVSSLSLNGAFQIHKDIDALEGLQYYFGGGASVVIWNVNYGDGTTSLGLQGYIGASYTFSDIPLNLSVDWIPTLFINGLTGYGRGFSPGYGTIAARYVLGSNNSKQTEPRDK